MKANVGDCLVAEGPSVGHGRRECVVLSVRHPDGTPPFEVKWTDTGKISVLFPGPDMHLRHPAHAGDANA